MTRKMVIGSRLPSATLRVTQHLAVVNGNGTWTFQHVYPTLTGKLAFIARSRLTLNTRASGMRL